MTIYLRFFHLETSHFSFLAIESLVTLASLLVSLLLPWRRFGFRLPSMLRRPGPACLAVFLFCCVGRVLLLAVEPFPEPNVHDEFSYLLAGDTLAHGRLTNPTPPCWHHFEAFYVILKPTYASRYGVAQPLFMAAGQRLAGSPRSGIVIATALASASLCWMLWAYLPPRWALLGGLLVVVRIAWFSYFGNTYWGGSVAMLGGCLLLGAAARLANKPSRRAGLLMAVGLLLLLNTRPYEGAMLALPVCCFSLVKILELRANWRVWLPGIALLLGGFACTALYFHRVTGAFTFPWVAYWRRWSTVPPFLFGSVNHVRYQFPEQAVFNNYYEMLPYRSVRERGQWATDFTFKAVTQWLFFIFPALTLPLIGVVPTLRARATRWLMFVLFFTVAAFAIETWLLPQYAAVVAGIVYLVLINGLRWMYVAGRRQPVWGKLMRGLLAAVILMAVVRLVVVPRNTFPPDWASQTGEIPGYQDVHRFLAAMPNMQLVLVRYRPGHISGFSWINNGYDIPSQHVIWARDTEPVESNLPLLCTFRDRRVWLLEPPEAGFIRPPDRTAPWDPAPVKQFLRAYPAPAAGLCRP